MADRSGYIGRAPGDSSVIIARQTFAPVAITTDFTFASGYTPGYVDVYVDGLRKLVGTDYSATDGSVVSILNGGVSVGSTAVVVAYKAFNVANPISNIGSGSLSVGTDLTVGDIVTINGTTQSSSKDTGAIICEGGVGIEKNLFVGGGAEVTGILTVTNTLDANGALDVDGHTELDDVNVSGASTFTGAADFNGAIDVDGHTELDDVNVSGASTFTGIGTFISDLYVGGNLNVTGDITYDEVSGRNLDISGIATIATLGVSAATTSKDLLVTGVSTFSGIGTFASDVYIDGNLNVVGDLVYDEVSGRNLDISGIATIATLGVSIAATTKDLLVTGVSTVSTLKVGTAATINSSGLDVVGIASVGVAITMYGSSGIVSATSFYGALTGNVTGNVTGDASGSSGSCTGNAGGLTGTPDITVRNITGVAATFTGVVTYEDVTNVDSIGIVTARGGFEIGAAGVGGTITAVGNAEFVGIVTAQSYVSIADSIVHTGDINTSLRFPSADTITAETGGSERMRVTANGGLLLSNGILVEHCKIVSTAWSTTNDISLDDGNVFLNTANLAGTNNTIDITSTNGLNVDLAVGDMTSVTLITAVNATTAFINSITIAAATPTISWVGGSAPTDGGGSGYDVYTFNIIKTAANTYVCIANQVKGS